MSSESSHRNAGNCNSLLRKVQDRRVFCVGLFSGLIGLWGFSDITVVTPVSREAAELIAPDVLAQPQEPVLLSARLFKTRLFMQTGLGGEPVDFLVDGTSIGQTMTGGDGWARKEYLPTQEGMLEVTIKLAEGKRVKAQSRTAIIGSVNRKRPIVLVELEAAMMRVERPAFGPFDLSALGQSHGDLSEPMPGAAKSLGTISRRASLLYLLVGQISQLPDVHDWLAEHGFPSGPVFILQPGTRALGSRVEGWKDEGWANIKAGVSRNIDSVEQYVDQELQAVMILDEDDEEDVPEGATVVSKWDDLATLKALKFIK